jgi:hypothetical protein
MILAINTYLSPKQHLSSGFAEDKDFALSEDGNGII